MLLFWAFSDGHTTKCTLVMLVIHCVCMVESYYHYYSLLLYLMAELITCSHISGFCYIVGHISVDCISLFMVNQIFSMATTLMEYFQVFFLMFC